MFVCFLSYKLFLLDRFSLDEPDIAREVAEGFRNKKELKIYKRTIDEDDYFVLGNFKIRNDFKDCKLDKRTNEMEPFQYICNDSKFIFLISSNTSLDISAIIGVIVFSDNFGIVASNI